MRTPAAALRPKPARQQYASFPVPTAGLISNRNLAIPSGQGQQPGAEVLNNWFPTPQGVRLRRGTVRRATLPEGLPVRSLFTYTAGETERLFACTDSGIWDVTVVPEAYSQAIAATTEDAIGADVDTAFGWESVDPDANLYPCTNGEWITIQFSTAGGSFVIGVNGVDEGFIYDGTSFEALGANFPAGSTLTTADLSYVWAYKQRIYFVGGNSLSAWYLPVDQIGGDLTELPLGGVFNRGGNLMFGQTWSLDSGGDGGLSEQNIFVTTTGEVAAYQGLSPDSASDWSLVGTYRIGKPLGKRAVIRAGGDIIIATTIGLIPLSQAIKADYAALGLIAISQPITDAWRDAVEDRGSENWVCELWGEGSMMLVAPPTFGSNQPLTFVTNSDSGAWCKFTEWLPVSMETFRGRLYFGSTNGRLMEAWVGGSDEGRPYTAEMIPLFNDLGQPSQRKAPRWSRVVTRSSYPITEKITARFDWDTSIPAAPDAVSVPIGNEWDNGIWDVSVWDAERGAVVQGPWRSVGGSGYAASVCVQVTSSSVVPLDVEVVRVDYSWESAGPMS